LRNKNQKRARATATRESAFDDAPWQSLVLPLKSLKLSVKTKSVLLSDSRPAAKSTKMQADVVSARHNSVMTTASMPISHATMQTGAFDSTMSVFNSPNGPIAEQSKWSRLAMKQRQIYYMYGNSSRRYFASIWWSYQMDVARQKYAMWKRARYIKTKIYCPECYILRDLGSNDPLVCVS
jgi:hypothetical protein